MMLKITETMENKPQQQPKNKITKAIIPNVIADESAGNLF